MWGLGIAIGLYLGVGVLVYVDLWRGYPVLSAAPKFVQEAVLFAYMPVFSAISGLNPSFFPMG